MKEKEFWIQNGWRFLIMSLTLMTAYQFSGFISVDQGMYLQAASLFLDGFKPYVDIIDINPPMIIYLNVIPVALAKAFSISLLWALALLVSLLIIVCASLLKKILIASTLFKNEHVMFVDFIFFLSALYVLLRNSYGQREHLFSICFVPYLFLRILRPEIKAPLSVPVVVSIGMLCGIMSALKPYFILIVFALEAFLIYSEKNWRGLKKPEVFCFLTIIFLYMAHFLFWPHDMFRAFFGELVPMVLKYYNSMDYPTVDLLQKLAPSIFAFILTVILFVNLRKKIIAWQKKMFHCLIVAGIAALGMCLLQHKGWTYQIIPFIFVIAIVLTFSAIYFLENLKKFTIKQKIINFLFIGLILFYFLDPLRIPVENMSGIFTSTDDIFSKSNGFMKWSMRQVLVAGDKIVVFSATPAYLYPYITQMGYWPGTRYMFHFPLVFFNSRYTTDLQKPYPYKTLEQMVEGERQYVERVQEDVEKNKPKMLAFASNRHKFSFLPANFDVFEYFKVNGSWDKWKPYYEFSYKEHDIVVFKRKI